MVIRSRGRARSERRRWRTPRVSSARQRYGRRRATGCLLWVVGLIVVLIILSLLFGGFRMGTKAGGAGVLSRSNYGAVVAGGSP
jgi:hypothetical protein